MTEGNKKIGIDFDGVLVDRSGIVRGHEFIHEEPVKDAKDAVIWMKDKGYEPYVFTNRPEEEHRAIDSWLELHEFPGMLITNVKQPGTLLYIDDRAVRFTNWQDVCKLLG